MQLMVIGASRGLGRAFVEGLAEPGDFVTGVSRSTPDTLEVPQSVGVRWISADLADPVSAAQKLEVDAPAVIDVLIYNVGIWEPEAFGAHYDFLSQGDTTCLLASDKPRLILTGSTSALPGNGRPEVAFGASKTALNGIASALREGFRHRGLGVTLLQLGYLNTEDALSVPVDQASARGGGEQIPVHDVVAMVKAMLTLSPSSFVRELVLPAVADSRF